MASAGLFTGEQREFARAVESFCADTCGSAEQRAQLTDGGQLSNSPVVLRKLAELGWLGVSIPRPVRRRRCRHGRRMHLPRRNRTRPGADSRLRHRADRRPDLTAARH